MLGNTQKEISELLEIVISEDKLQASLTIIEPDPEIMKQITSLKIINILDRGGVKSGIKKDAIDKILTEKKWNEEFIVAEAKLPTPGNNAKIELYFQTQKSLRPKIRENGQVDYKEVCNVNSIEKNADLLKKIPPTRGSPGKDVEGNEITPEMGEDIAITAGKGTYWDSNNPTLLKAAEDGIVCYDAHKSIVEVNHVYIIQGSVDYSTGNINVKSSVDIKGDVKSGFTITTPYSVMIKGVVENAVISCDGCLKVGSGIMSENKQVITVGGDIHSGYINNQHIRCRGSIYASTEIRNAFIECDNEVILTKPNGIIIGGVVTATNKIVSGFIGNAYGVLTEIIVGINPGIRKQLMIKEEEKKCMEKKVNDLITRITYIAQHTPAPLVEERLAMYKNEWQECVTKLEILSKEVSDLEIAYYSNPDSIVMITKTIYPGSVIKIKQFTFEIKEELSHVKFYLEEDEIKFNNIE